MNEELLAWMQKSAERDMESFGRLEGDWLRQMRKYRQIVKKVTRLQARMTSVFGTPELCLRPVQRDLEGHDPLRATVNANAYLAWQAGVIDMRELDRVEVRPHGACVLQAQLVTQLETEARVDYVAILHVDENYALERELPNTKTLVRVDPDYTLYRFSIHVPRKALVSESLRAIGKAMRAKKPKATIGGGAIGFVNPMQGNALVASATTTGNICFVQPITWSINAVGSTTSGSW